MWRATEAGSSCWPSWPTGTPSRVLRVRSPSPLTAPGSSASTSLCRSSLRYAVSNRKVVDLEHGRVEGIGFGKRMTTKEIVSILCILPKFSRYFNIGFLTKWPLTRDFYFGEKHEAHWLNSNSQFLVSHLQEERVLKLFTIGKNHFSFIGKKSSDPFSQIDAWWPFLQQKHWDTGPHLCK